VAFGQEGALFCYKETNEPNKHSQLLSVFVKDLMDEYGIAPEEIDAVALSEGPGSYTGLRIGASFAKGLCYGLDIPFIAVGTLSAMAHWFVETVPDIDAGDLLCPMIDARRMEVYTALFDSEAKEQTPVSAKIIDSSSFEKELSAGKVHFFGNGADKCSSLLEHDHALFHPQFQHSSKGMLGLAWQKFRNEEFSDIAYFEPFYLKDFVATVSKKSIFT